VIRQFAHAFEQRDADALVRIWPTIGAEYEGYKTWFEKVNSIRMNVEIESIQVSPDGDSAEVKAQVHRQYTSIDSKTVSAKEAKIFQLSKVDDAWIITDVQLAQSQN
jgi:ketosteroid isomerase-like protein